MLVQRNVFIQQNTMILSTSENHEMSPLFQLCKNLNSHSNLSISFVPINIFPELNRLLWSCNRKINSHVPSYSQLNSISLPPNKIDLYAVCMLLSIKNKIKIERSERNDFWHQKNWTSYRNMFKSNYVQLVLLYKLCLLMLWYDGSKLLLLKSHASNKIKLSGLDFSLTV